MEYWFWPDWIRAWEWIVAEPCSDPGIAAQDGEELRAPLTRQWGLWCLISLTQEHLQTGLSTVWGCCCGRTLIILKKPGKIFRACGESGFRFAAPVVPTANRNPCTGWPSVARAGSTLNARASHPREGFAAIPSPSPLRAQSCSCDAAISERGAPWGRDGSWGTKPAGSWNSKLKIFQGRGMGSGKTCEPDFGMSGGRGGSPSWAFVPLQEEELQQHWVWHQGSPNLWSSPVCFMSSDRSPT